MLSIASDFSSVECSRLERLEDIAESGFSHVHWCQHWCGDYVYALAEVNQIRRWLDDLSLQLQDLHATAGTEKCWFAEDESARQAGVELVANRIEMCSALGGKYIVLHFPSRNLDKSKDWERARKSLDELAPFAERSGVAIAAENSFDDNFVQIRRMLKDYPAKLIGVCYDSGHGNMGGQGLDYLEEVKDRLLVTHVNDNNGYDDLHEIPWHGTVDWNRFAGIIRESSLGDVLTIELSMHCYGELAKQERKGRRAFLAMARQAGERLWRQIQKPS